MNDFEKLAYPDALRMPKAGDTVYVKFHNQPYRKERLMDKLSSGGEGNIFATENYGSMVIKLYHPEKLTRGRVEKITALAEEIWDVNSGEGFSQEVKVFYNGIQTKDFILSTSDDKVKVSKTESGNALIKISGKNSGEYSFKVQCENESAEFTWNITFKNMK